MRERGSDSELLERLALEILLNDPRVVSLRFESIDARTNRDGSVSLSFLWMPAQRAPQTKECQP